MQNVAWPSTIVQNENGISASAKAERSEMPVMMPGNAIGRMRSSDTDSRPKKRERLTAAAASVPSSIASTVETAATRTLSHSACCTSGRPQATANQRVVRPGGGNW